MREILIETGDIDSKSPIPFSKAAYAALEKVIMSSIQSSHCPELYYYDKPSETIIGNYGYIPRLTVALSLPVVSLIEVTVTSVEVPV